MRRRSRRVPADRCAGRPSSRMRACQRTGSSPGLSGSNSVSSTVSPTSGMCPSFSRTSPPIGLVVALRGAGTVSRSRPRRSAAVRHLPAGAALHHIRCGVVVFVAHVADDLLDEVLEGDHARGAAVFVDDHGGLDAVARGSGSSPRRRPGVRGHGRHRHRQPRQRGGGAALDGHLEDLLDVHHADGLVQVAVDDREARVAGADGGVQQIGDGVLQSPAIRSWTAGSSAPRRNARRTAASGRPGRRCRRPATAARRGTHQRHQFLRGARRAQFLGRFDAHPAQDPVGGAVGGLDHRREQLREVPLRRAGETRGGQRLWRRPGSWAPVHRRSSTPRWRSAAPAPARSGSTQPAGIRSAVSGA